MNNKEKVLENLLSAIECLKIAKMAVEEGNSKDFSYAIWCAEKDIEIVKRKSKDLFIIDNIINKF